MEFPPTMAFTCQLTAGFAAFATAAVNCAVPPVATRVEEPLTLTVAGSGAGGSELTELFELPAVPEQEISNGGTARLVIHTEWPSRRRRTTEALHTSAQVPKRENMTIAQASQAAEETIYDLVNSRDRAKLRLNGMVVNTNKTKTLCKMIGVQRRTC
jgi:hypothetical protein